ncbi:hypothetical protein GLOIN_2v1562144 [Rhizophagus irregularis DAOM 181602=DAOM 197198]|uniref:Uncharacterized protein n=1 Tax=Rhizophagus irregularis (strain DAOM 181602 / DAOM 197198 / MUCL 43194) TaxID=747089 RepID=A0A2P4QDQ1_RHIID|nr:hypothetical protein GLOIN_2v1562144 [Rhizophagus irregularis DAOM 181602=DAOM 197198]POG75754.1 hypothetical protein GLOIN_2v1562144 [Rhizophagus irregularis DAOM 181602=DAOM 197198]|eukprot:XP_025182620.1 hypothetical protein GLOIN_2v1562144 [Rhizophagus irregularis DAOM 181602=DAOM 197198]
MIKFFFFSGKCKNPKSVIIRFPFFYYLIICYESLVLKVKSSDNRLEKYNKV